MSRSDGAPIKSAKGEHGEGRRARAGRRLSQAWDKGCQISEEASRHAREQAVLTDKDRAKRLTRRREGSARGGVVEAAAARQGSSETESNTR